MKNEFGKVWKEGDMCYYKMCRGVEVNYEKNCQNSLNLGWHLNPGCPEHKAGVLPLNCSVAHLYHAVVIFISY
jgi:hypothetical protein